LGVKDQNIKYYVLFKCTKNEQVIDPTIVCNVTTCSKHEPAPCMRTYLIMSSLNEIYFSPH